ncbi:MAG: carboxypeptidase regulatory-like domain-containing protein, partial [Bryobacterales bacterium]|nr:carboxypeptidase regulatory-like domain-containing protein [Bryobacterales bacterium]
MLLNVVLATFAVWGQQPLVVQQYPERRAPQAQTYKPEELCKIDGVVKHAVTGEPVRKASLVLMPIDMRNMPAPLTTVTDAEGKFSMKDVEPGQYRFIASKAGFVQTNYGATPANRQGTTLTLAKGQSAKDIEFRLQPHAVITGRVLDEDGDPVQYAQVQLMSYRTMQGKRQLVPSTGASTNDLGEYRVFGIPPGKYYLSVIQRERGMAFGGVDRSASQTPDEGYPTTYYPGTLDLSGATQLNIATGSMMQGMDVTLRKVRTFRIRGRVSGVAAGMRGGNVSVMPKGVSEYFLFAYERTNTMWRGPSGEFELRGVRPGTYVVTAQGWEPPSKQFIGKETIDIRDSDVEGVTIAISPGVEVSGTLRIESDAPTEAKLEEINVALMPLHPGTPAIGNSAKVTKDGTFVASASAETFSVRPFGMPPEFYLKSVRLGDIDVLEKELNEDEERLEKDDENFYQWFNPKPSVYIKRIARYFER